MYNEQETNFRIDTQRRRWQIGRAISVIRSITNEIYIRVHSRTMRLIRVRPDYRRRLISTLERRAFSVHTRRE